MDRINRRRVGELWHNTQIGVKSLIVGLNGLADKAVPSRIERRETLDRMQIERRKFLETWEKIKIKMEAAVGTDALSEAGRYREVRFDPVTNQLVEIDYDNNIRYREITGTTNYFSVEIIDTEKEENIFLRKQLIAYQNETNSSNRSKLRDDIDKSLRQRTFEGVVIKESKPGLIEVDDRKRKGQNIRLFSTDKDSTKFERPILLQNCMLDLSAYVFINLFLTEAGLSVEQVSSPVSMVMIRPVLKSSK